MFYANPSFLVLFMYASTLRLTCSQITKFSSTTISRLEISWSTSFICADSLVIFKYHHCTITIDAAQVRPTLSLCELYSLTALSLDFTASHAVMTRVIYNAAFRTTDFYHIILRILTVFRRTTQTSIRQQIISTVYNFNPSDISNGATVYSVGQKIG